MDRLRQVFRRFVGRARIKHQRTAELYLIAAGERVVLDSPAVDIRAVGALQIDQSVNVTRSKDFGVLPGDFGVVELDRVGGLASKSDGSLLELEPRALVVSTDHKQGRHSADSEIACR